MNFFQESKWSIWETRRNLPSARFRVSRGQSAASPAVPLPAHVAARRACSVFSRSMLLGTVPSRALRAGALLSAGSASCRPLSRGTAGHCTCGFKWQDALHTRIRSSVNDARLRSAQSPTPQLVHMADSCYKRVNVAHAQRTMCGGRHSPPRLGARTAATSSAHAASQRLMVTPAAQPAEPASSPASSGCAAAPRPRWPLRLSSSMWRTPCPARYLQMVVRIH